MISVGCTVALLAGCSSHEEADRTPVAERPAKGSVTQSSAPAFSTPATSVAEPSTYSSSASSEQKPEGQCSAAPVKNPLTGDKPIPVKFANTEGSKVGFHYTVVEGQPDPCKSLSWIKLAGTNGVEGPGATAGSNRETVALFADGQLITEPAPILARRIESVDQLDYRTVKVSYAFAGDESAATNTTQPGSATFQWSGDKVEVVDNTIPASQNESAETLDLRSVE